MICTTLNKIRAHDPCASGWGKLLRHLGKTQADDESLPLAVIVESNGVDDALWALRTLPEHNNLWRLYAVWCARQVQHLMTDKRSLDALDIAERHANGEATDEELAAAGAAARAAGAAALAAWDAARAALAAGAAALAAWDAGDAALAAWDAARAARAARAAGAAGAAALAAWDAAGAAGAAARAAGAAARAAGAAGAAARAAQKAQFLHIVNGSQA